MKKRGVGMKEQLFFEKLFYGFIVQFLAITKLGKQTAQKTLLLLVFSVFRQLS
jgi:hypothetical protein